MRAILLPLALLLGAASPRPFVQLDEPVVRLGDLFEAAGPRAEAALGPAPAPGARQVVEAPQLAAIARSHGLPWRPATGTERVVIERAARAVPREDAMAALRAALRGQGLDDAAEIEPAGFAAPLVPERAFVQLSVESAQLDAAAGRFAATLVVAAEGMPTQRLRLAGRVVPTVPVVLAARRLQPGEVLRPADLREVRIPASRLRPGAAQDAAQVLGQALRRPAAADQPLLLADLAAPAAVERGQTVTMSYESPGLLLTAQGRALDAAPRGARVAVMNLASRQVVEAEVVGPGRVRVGRGR